MTRIPSTSPSTLLPHLVTEIPGPRSRALAERLRRVESPNITFITPNFPVFFHSASDCLITDVDGNRFLDLTAGFGVAAAGHNNPRVVAALKEQSDRLLHALGDVHPAAVKVELAEALAALAPGDLSQVIFASAGSEAVEAALKTAMLYTGKPGVLAFTGAYHGLTYGALDATHSPHFRSPFEKQLAHIVRHVPFPNPYHFALSPADATAHSLAATERAIAEAHQSDKPIGAVLIEPILGRGGIVPAPPDFLPALRELCDRHRLVLIADEIYTGLGRTGRLFAVDHAAVVPDLLCIGKALAGGFPISACIGRPHVMAAWPPSTGEAIHTSTFLGSPLGCAMAFANLREIQDNRLVERAAELGAWLLSKLRDLALRHPSIGDVRGLGLMLAVEIVRDRATRAPLDASPLVLAGLCRGLIWLAAGPGNILTLTPPLTITRSQLEFALRTLDECLPTVEG